MFDALPPLPWDSAAALTALDGRDVGAMFKLASRHGWSQTAIGVRCGMSQAEVSRISVGKRQVTSLETFLCVAEGLGMPHHARARMLGLAPTGRHHTHGVVDSAHPQGAPSGQAGPVAQVAGPAPNSAAAREDTTDRRQLLRFGGFASAGMAADLSDRIARADPTPLTLREIGLDIGRIAASYRMTPHADLVPRVEAGWLGTERILDGRVTEKARKRLTLYAGQYAYYLSQLAWGLGSDQAAVAYLSVAGQHATESGDLVLAGSVAAMDSALAFFGGDYAVAADIAARARTTPHPYTRPQLAALEARAAGRAGRADAARAALDDMQNHVWTGEILPGANPIDEEAGYAYHAVALSHLGAGEEAEPHAWRSLQLLAGTGQLRDMGGTYVALGRAFVRRAQPDPEQATAAAADALRVIDGQPCTGVIDQVGQLWREMNARWSDLPAVRDLSELLHTARRALPPAAPSSA